MTEERRQQLLKLHTDLHSQSNNSHIAFEDKLLVRQGPTNTVYGRLVKAGHQVTLIQRTGKKWGAIVDQEIWDPADGE